MDKLNSYLQRRFATGTVLLGFLLLPGMAPAQWVSPPGEGWAQVSVYHHDTRTEFDNSGAERVLPEEGHSTITSAFLTVAHGLISGIDGWVQVPYQRLQYDNFSGERTTSGIGDVRLFLRIGPRLLNLPSIPVSIRGGVKLPFGDFDVDAESIPLGEGQVDWEVMMEVGHSFYPVEAYVAAWAGYRWRTENADINRKPGNERFFYAAAGGRLSKASWKVYAEGFFGEAPVIFGIPIPSSSRELVSINPSVGWPVGRGFLEAGARIPLAGKNHINGPTLVLGYFAKIK